jgi:hypothetical protein
MNAWICATERNFEVRMVADQTSSPCTAGTAPNICRDASGIIELTGQINAVMTKEASVIRDMSSLPEKEQVQFWHEEFAPLLTQEHALRETLLAVGQRTSPESMH